MNPSLRRASFVVFLALGAAGFFAASGLSGPWDLVVDAALVLALFFVGERVFWPRRAAEPLVVSEPVVLTPALDVPLSFQDASPEEEAAAQKVGTADAEVEPPEEESSPGALSHTDRGEELARELLPVFHELLELLAQPSPLVGELTEIQGGVDFVRENVVRGYEISDNLANSAKQAFDLSEKVQNGVKIVTDALSQSLQQTKVLYEHSLRIAKILGLLGEVSDKIHILSINASIVSARAGATGRGFEVVAKEIRSLAKETELSLGEIEEVIGLLQSTISTVIRVVTDADKETEEEKSSLISVAGSLQGVILGVEIIRAVSSFAKEKSEENSTAIARMLQQTVPAGSGVQAKVAEWALRLQDYLPKE